MDLYLAFVLATVVLILIPGPNVALIVANSVAYGSRYGLLTVAGTGSAIAIQLALTVLGMAALLGALAEWFEWLRWAGVAYLVYLGVRVWCAPATDLGGIAPQPKSVRALFWRGFLVSATNPKTLLFYGAFFPQFVDPGHDLASQLLMLSASFLVISTLGDVCWALLVGSARGLLAGRARLRNRLTGGLLIGASLGLALARKS